MFEKNVWRLKIILFLYCHLIGVGKGEKINSVIEEPFLTQGCPLHF